MKYPTAFNVPDHLLPLVFAEWVDYEFPRREDLDRAITITATKLKTSMDVDEQTRDDLRRWQTHLLVAAGLSAGWVKKGEETLKWNNVHIITDPGAEEETEPTDATPPQSDDIPAVNFTTPDETKDVVVVTPDQPRSFLRSIRTQVRNILNPAPLHPPPPPFPGPDVTTPAQIITAEQHQTAMAHVASVQDEDDGEFDEEMIQFLEKLGLTREQIMGSDVSVAMRAAARTRKKQASDEMTNAEHFDRELTFNELEIMAKDTIRQHTERNRKHQQQECDRQDVPPDPDDNDEWAIWCGYWD
jgi:hypothetical protein